MSIFILFQFAQFIIPYRKSRERRNRKDSGITSWNSGKTNDRSRGYILFVTSAPGLFILFKCLFLRFLLEAAVLRQHHFFLQIC